MTRLPRTGSGARFDLGSRYSKFRVNLAAIRRSLGSDLHPGARRRNPGAKPLPVVDLLGESVKVAKGSKRGYLTAVMYLAPATEAGRGTMCAHATEGCAAACLFTSGKGTLEGVRRARVLKTLGFKDDQELFMQLLTADVARHINRVEKKNRDNGEDYTPIVRLNGTSDVLWELIPVPRTPALEATFARMRGDVELPPLPEGRTSYRNIFEIFPKQQFYDYTKFPLEKRMSAFRAKYGVAWPKNYHLTFSLSEAAGSEEHARWALDHGHPVAAVFNTMPGRGIPSTLTLPGGGTYETHDADETDLRFLDPQDSRGRGKIAWLSAKMDAKGDTSGFVRDAHTGRPITSPDGWTGNARKKAARERGGERVKVRQKTTWSASKVQFKSWEEAFRKTLTWPAIASYASGGKRIQIDTVKGLYASITRHSPSLRRVGRARDHLQALKGLAAKHGLDLTIDAKGHIAVQRSDHAPRLACAPTLSGRLAQFQAEGGRYGDEQAFRAWESQRCARANPGRRRRRNPTPSAKRLAHRKHEHFRHNMAVKRALESAAYGDEIERRSMHKKASRHRKASPSFMRIRRMAKASQKFYRKPPRVMPISRGHAAKWAIIGQRARAYAF